jgi:hypothetical protein
LTGDIAHLFLFLSFNNKDSDVIVSALPGRHHLSNFPQILLFLQAERPNNFAAVKLMSMVLKTQKAPINKFLLNINTQKQVGYNFC